MSVEARITAALGSFGDPVEKSLLYAAPVLHLRLLLPGGGLGGR